jgi:hypothetical protein
VYPVESVPVDERVVGARDDGEFVPAKAADQRHGEEGCARADGLDARFAKHLSQVANHGMVREDPLTVLAAPPRREPDDDVLSVREEAFLRRFRTVAPRDESRHLPGLGVGIQDGR